jgi:hypothetical protein
MVMLAESVRVGFIFSDPYQASTTGIAMMVPLISHLTPDISVLG